jgi:hypothetical protein
VAAPALPPNAEYIRVRLSATNAPRKEWSEPVSIYFRRAGAGWQLVGFERVP